MEKFQYLSKAKLNSLPKAPGVYALASLQTVLYIGKAANIRNRAKNHFQQSTYRDNLFIQDVTKVGYIKTDSDIDALLLESQLIKKQQPRYNVMWKDDKKYFYVAITKEKLPRVFLTHQPTDFATGASTDASRAIPTAPPELRSAGRSLRQGINYIGPFVEGKAIKQVLKLLRRVFPYYTAKKHGQLPCSWCHIDLCPGPAPQEKEYQKNIKKLTAVLKGKRKSVLSSLKKEMQEASKLHDFEKAAFTRDQLLALEHTISNAALFVSPLQKEKQDWLAVEKELQKILKTTKRISRIEAYDISNIQGQQATGSQVTFLKGAPAKDSWRKYKIRIAGKPNDFAMIEELLLRRLQHPEWPYPHLMVIDGGKGQLSAALKAISNLTKLSYPHLNEIKLRDIKVVALAKKRNELFFPGRKNSVLLSDLPKPVENLFLFIRDEAHRFAISYHRTLRSKNLFLKSS